MSSSDDGNEEDDFLWASLEAAEEEEEQVPSRNYPNYYSTNTDNDLPQLMRKLQTSCCHNDSHSQKVVCGIIQSTMGTMALCRGKNGQRLYEAGAVDALKAVLQSTLQDDNNNNHEHQCDDDDDCVLLLVVLGALRDLACGNVQVRSAVIDILPTLYDLLLRLSTTTTTTTTENDDDNNEHDDRRRSVSIPTAIMGVFRNVTHVHRPNCQRLQELGLTTYLTDRVLHRPPPRAGDSRTREFYYRSAATLLNMVERCEEDDDDDDMTTTALPVLDHLLSTYTGGRELIHKGMLRLLRQNTERYSEILNKEQNRKRVAQARETQRRSLQSS